MPPLHGHLFEEGKTLFEDITFKTSPLLLNLVETSWKSKKMTETRVRETDTTKKNHNILAPIGNHVNK